MSRTGALPIALLALLALPACAGKADAPPAASTWEPFVAMAREAGCAGRRNQLFIIDQELVLWDRAGDCPDNSYSLRLYRRRPDALLCSSSDSIAGPRTTCAAAEAQPLFEILIAHRDEPNLGLGPEHAVQPLPFTPAPGADGPRP